MKKKLRFEDALQRLEEITTLLDSGEAGLEDALALFTEGAELVQLCEHQLGEAKLKIKTLFPQTVLEDNDDE